MVTVPRNYGASMIVELVETIEPRITGTTVDDEPATTMMAECQCPSCLEAMRALARKYRTVTLHCPTCRRVFCAVRLRVSDPIPAVRCEGCIREGRMQPWPET